MDELDRDIVDHLKADGRASFTAIADDLGVSEGTVRNRVQQLQDDGTIERFTVDLSEDDQISAVVMIRVDPEQDITAIIDAFPDDTRIDEVTGNWDIIVRFSRPTSTAVNDTLEAIRKIDGVTDTKTYTVLASHTK